AYLRPSVTHPDGRQRLFAQRLGRRRGRDVRGCAPAADGNAEGRAPAQASETPQRLGIVKPQPSFPVISTEARSAKRHVISTVARSAEWRDRSIGLLPA